MNARDAKVVELVCESCGYRSCTVGRGMCRDAFLKVAGFCTREEYERRHVEERAQASGDALTVEFSGSFTRKDLAGLSPEQIQALYDGTGKLQATHVESERQKLRAAA